ncbi:hypothetical protein G7Y31_05515 [Corynebacterium lizhenjunii]|uniref:Uncharacterized protein n=1 Tax=Corynebacterium lizhenjunii TaxID=2709394 RepID=A0A7T0KH90_9CORY|nr:hypothetical protein [Corynebacterium lizhenjunii]QPK80139.1 hypothetical protein G7Y31_05515 [Corynebacterium lizhenjunii]
MTTPRPHDPRAVMDPQELARRMDAVLADAPEGAEAEFVQLDRAHSILREVLQER